MHTLFHKKRNPSKIVFPFFWSVISPKSSRDFSFKRIPGNSTAQKETKNGEKKRRAFQLSQWVHWEKMAPVEISSSKRWQERSKPHFQGPKKPVKKRDGEMGPKHKPSLFSWVSLGWNITPYLCTDCFTPFFRWFLGPPRLKNTSSVLAAMLLLGAFYSVQKWSCFNSSFRTCVEKC